MADGKREGPEGAGIARLAYKYHPGAGQGGPNFLARLELTGPSSGELTYTVTVVDVNGSPLASQSVNGDGGSTIDLAFVVSADATPSVAAAGDPSLGVYATVSAKGQEYQRFPEQGTVAVTPLSGSDYGDDPNDWPFGP